MALDAQILLSILAHESSSEDISRTLRATPASYSLTLGDGTGANQAQVVWSDARTISAEETLTTTALSDDRGSVAFSAIKAVYIKNTHATIDIDARSSLFGQSAIGIPSLVRVRPGGILFSVDPTAQGRGAPSITVSPSSTGGTYEIIVIGEGTVT